MRRGDFPTSVRVLRGCEPTGKLLQYAGNNERLTDRNMYTSWFGSGRNALLVTCVLLTLSTPPFAARAEGTTYACKVDIAGGLKWDSGKWKVRRLFEDKFLLEMEGSTFTSDSVARVLKARPVTCTVRAGERISCMDARGGYLLFDPRTSRGGIAQLHGTTDERQDYRDTVSVEAFSCERR